MGRISKYPFVMRMMYQSVCRLNPTQDYYAESN